MSTPENGTEVRPAAAWLTLALLFVAYNLSMLDRIVIGLLVEPIKASLRLSDTQISLLQGFAFLLFYSVIGLPLGLLVDRWNRTRLIAAGLALWSSMTMLCGFANSYGLLFIGRAGVGIGEATLSPAAFSLISNSFSRHRLALPLGIYSFGGATGAGLALLVGGYAYSHFASYGRIVLQGGVTLEPWQATFVVVGAPALLVGLLFLLLPEPTRRPSVALTDGGWKDFVRFYQSHRGLIIPHHLGVALSNMAALGVTMWIGAFFSRVHGWSIGKTGLIAGLSAFIAGILGLVLAGWLSDRLYRSGRLSRIGLCIATAPVGIVAALCYALLPSAIAACIALCLFLACTMLQFNVANAAYQAILPDHIRGIASASLLLTTGLMSSLGPICVALMTDHLLPGALAIRSATAIFGGACFALMGFCFVLAERSYPTGPHATTE